MQICPMLEKEPNNFHASFLRRKVQWSAAVVVLGIWVYAKLEKRLNNFHVSFVRC